LSGILVESIQEGGLIDDWNKQHKEFPLRPGDLIIEANGSRGADMRNHLGTQAANQTGPIKFVVERGSTNDASSIQPQEQLSFTVELERPEGSQFGWYANFKENHDGILVEAVFEGGLIDNWNKQKQGIPIEAGDVIVETNGSSGIAMIKYLGAASKETGPIKFSVKKGGADDQPQARPFLLELERKEGLGFGWTASFSSDRTSILVEAVTEGGLIDNWNQQHPDSCLEPGDIIVEANGARGEGMLAHLGAEAAAQSGQIRLVAKKGTPLEATPPDEITVEVQRAEGKKYGWQISFKSDFSGILVEEVHKGGLIDAWNQQHKRSRLEVGDVIISANGLQGQDMKTHLGPQAANEVGPITFVVKKAERQKVSKWLQCFQGRQVVPKNGY